MAVTEKQLAMLKKIGKPVTFDKLAEAQEKRSLSSLLGGLKKAGLATVDDKGRWVRTPKGSEAAKSK